MATRDPVADDFEECERRLNEWGAACRRNSEHLGLPRMSSMAQMIKHVRAQQRMERGVRKKRLRKKHRQQARRKERIDAKEKAELLGFADHDETAKGKQKQTFRPVLDISSNIAEIDYVVATLPNWMRATIQRSYLYAQPDRKACQDLRIPKDTYRLRRMAAVEYVAERLAKKSARRV